MAAGMSTPREGQETMAKSQPVVIASDQSDVPVTDSFAYGQRADIINGTGSTTDAKVTGDTAGSLNAKMRGLSYMFNAIIDLVNNVLHTNIQQIGGTAIDVNSGNKSNGTQRVVLATDQPQNTNAFKVDGSAVTQPVSATALPLPTGAATSAKQPSLGTAGTASTDVITVQGIASMTPLKVDASATTVTVSLSNYAQETGGNLASVVAVEGATTDAKVTGDNTGTISGKLRGLTYYWGLVVDTVNSLIHTNVKQIGGTAIDVNSGNKSAGTQRVVLATDQPQNTNAFKVDGSAVTQPVSLAAAATGGYTPGKLISASGTNSTNIKGSAGTVGYLTASNINASPRYLKVYDKATAPTVGTDTPKHTFLIPGNTNGAGFMLPLPAQGIVCSNGIGIGITTGVADNDTGSVAANDIVINYGTK